MFKQYGFALLVTFGCIPLAVGEPLQKLRVPHIADAAPFMILNDQQQPESGLLYELYQVLSQQLALTMQIEAVPRKLVGKVLQKGDIDIYCNATPDWFTEANLRWSPPLFIHRDVVVSRRKYADFASFMQQAEGKIGTTFEYIYPTLSELFQNGRLLRVDSFSPRESLLLLQAGHLDAVVVSELELNYFLPDSEGLSSLVVAQDEIRCMYAPHLAEKQVQQLNDQLTLLIKQGDLIRIVDKYQ
jgi:polar amino acid transport system substrate-binding protein